MFSTNQVRIQKLKRDLNNHKPPHNMERIAVFPGSFDPVTKGHVSIALRALNLFDKLIISIGENSDKKYTFPLAKRLEWLQQVFEDEPKITVTSYEGLTVDFCRQMNAKYIIRGLRTSADFEFERSIGQINKKLYPEIETIFLLALPDLTPLNSSVVRELIRYGADVSQFIPDEIDITH